MNYLLTFRSGPSRSRVGQWRCLHCPAYAISVLWQNRLLQPSELLKLHHSQAINLLKIPPSNPALTAHKEENIFTLQWLATLLDRTNKVTNPARAGFCVVRHCDTMDGLQTSCLCQEGNAAVPFMWAPHRSQERKVAYAPSFSFVSSEVCVEHGWGEQKGKTRWAVWMAP